MPIASGVRLGPYEVVSPLGAGGMGEVYRARDTKLQREVAIKVLPDHFATDRDRLARFEREAQVLATLNHPHIAQIYGFEESGATRALVLELVEGETLAERISRGPIPLDEALPIARQIAQALEAAHEQGIIHRDLKPANIKITPAGVVKVLDFGLARLSELRDTSTASAMAMSPTITSPAMTHAGVILGTAAYMSPEQARGKTVDRRSDIWAFGCVLFEMLSGRRLFDAGDTISDVVAAILKNDPEWSLLPAGVPAHVRTLLRRSLQKDPQKRLPHVGLVRIELEDVADGAAPVPPPGRPLWQKALPMAAVAVLTAALVGSVMWATRPGTPVARVLRFSFPMPEGSQDGTFRALTLSPDGARLAFIGDGRLYVRSMSESDAKAVSGSESRGGYLAEPVFSPDGQSLAYWTGTNVDGTLRRISVGGGAAVALYTGSFPMGTTWDSSGIVFGQVPAGQPSRVIRLSPDSGAPETLVTAGPNESASNPQILPGGEAVLFTLARAATIKDWVQETWDRAEVVVQKLGSGERTTIVKGGSAARYLPTGHLTYAIGTTLFAQPFDVKRLTLTGPAVPVLTGVARTMFGPTAVGGTHLSVVDDGTLVYLAASSPSESTRLVSIDRLSGQAVTLNVPPGSYEHPRVSPDGKRLAVGIVGSNRVSNVWIYDLAGTSSIRQLTFEGSNRNPVWSNDGTRVAFQSDRESDFGIWWQRADGAAPAERLTKPEKGTLHVPGAWSPDGTTMLFAVEPLDASQVAPTRTLWMLRDGKVQPFGSVVTSALWAIAPVFSPDGRWVAYTSTPTPQGGQVQTYVQPFPATGANKHLVGNGIHPLWSRDGTELFVQTPGGPIARRVSTSQGIAFSDPSPLSNAQSRVIGPNVERNYDILLDGRFLGVRGEAAAGRDRAPAAAGQMQVVVNWFQELRGVAPPK